MSTSFIEKLYTAAEAVVAKSIRLVGGQDQAGAVAPFEMVPAGGVVVNQRAVPGAFSQRLQYEQSRMVLNKGTLKKFRTRLGILGESQESSRNVVGVVTTNKLSFVSSLGLFQIGDVVTGSISLATGTVTRVTSKSVEYTPLLGVFQIADIITGSVSLATATITILTTPNLIGQIIKIPQDNISGLMVTVETDTPTIQLDLFEASTLNMALMWTTIGLPPIRDTANKTQGSASIRLDHSIATVYTHAVSFIKHDVAIGGPFQVDELITGAISGATAVVGSVGNGFVRLISVVGIFQAGELITGGTSAATTTTTSVLLASEDWSSFENLFFDMSVSTKSEQAIILTISDGVNSASVTFANTVLGQFETKIVPLASLAASGLPAAVNLSGIASYSFTTAVKFKPNATSNIDNLVLSGVSGAMALSFYDLGPTLPVSGVTTLAGGVKKLLGDLGITGTQTLDVVIQLDGGKRLVQSQGFTHGVSVEIPTETLLTPGNYYALAFGYIDTDVKVYGTNPLLLGGYPNGYAFASPDVLSPIVSLGPNSDCMFALWTSDPTFIDRVVITPDAPVGLSGEYILVVEDSAMNMRILARGRLGDKGSVIEFNVSPVFLPRGGKLELYYTDDFSSPVRHIDISARHWSASQDSYIANP